MRSFSGLSLAVAAIVAVATLSSTVGCAKVNEIRARKAFKAANEAYKQQDYKKAADSYEEAVQADPSLFAAYFFLANSYDNQFKPSKKGEAQNDAFLSKAVTQYETAADKLLGSDRSSDGLSEKDRKNLGKLSLEYLQAAYGPDKLNDPAKAEPVVQRIIQMEPGEPTNYFLLARLYEDAGVYEEAEKVYLQAKEVKPNDPVVYTTLAAFYNKQGQFDKTIEALEQRAAKEPDNPEAWHTIAVYYEDKSLKDARLRDNEKRDYVMKGIAADDRALKIKPDYADAMVYKGLLLRLQANLEKDAGKQQALLKEAVQLHDKAEELKKKKAAGVGN